MVVARMKRWSDGAIESAIEESEGRKIKEVMVVNIASDTRIHHEAAATVARMTTAEMPQA